MKGRSIALLIVLVLLATVMVGCTGATQEGETSTDAGASTEASGSSESEASGSSEAGEDPVTLEFMCWGAAEEGTRPAFDAMINAFNDSHPGIQVEIVAEPFNSTLEQVLILNASGQAPDVMQIHSSFTAAMQGAGALANLDDLLSDELIADFYPNVLDALSYNDSQYALPWSPTPVVLFYNKTLLEKAGYTNSPTTIDEYEEMAAAVSALGADENGNTIYGTGVQSKAIGMTGIHFLFYLWSFGGEVIDENGTVVIDSPETVEAFEFAKSLIDQEISPVGLEIKDLRNLFAQGVVGFHIDGADYALNAFQSLAENPDEFMKQVGAAVLPTSGNTSPAGNGFFIEHNLGISENCENKEEALVFVDWLSGPEAVQIFNDIIGNKMPSRYSVAELDYYSKSDSEYMSVFLDALAIARGLPEKNAGFNDAMVSIANAVQRVCINDEDAATVVAELAVDLKEIYGS